MNAKKLFDLKRKTAIVTGALGQLGTQITMSLWEAGANVIISDLNLAECWKMASGLTKNGPKCVGMRVDVAKKNSIVKLAGQAIKEFGHIDILVNNAGIGVFTPFEKRKTTEFYKVLDVNLKGVFLCSQVIAGQMIKQKSGVIINIGSIYGMVSPDPRIYANSGRNSSEVYSCSKAGVIVLTRYLAVHLAVHNVRVNCISPGGIFNKQDPEFVSNYCERTPLRRMGDATDLKGAVIFLASEASSYVTGHNLVVDGGLTSW